jgi:hypothetical protein
MLLRNFRREKTLGEMCAAVIRTIKNLLWIARLWTRAPQMGTEPESVDAQKGTMMDIFAKCLKKNIAQVCTLPKSCAHCKEEFQLLANLIASIAGELTSKDHSSYVANVCVNLLVTASILFVLSHVQICHVITGIYFSAG